MQFATALKNLRAHERLTQEEFAERLNQFAEKSNGLYPSGFNKTSISKWERGHVEPRMDTLRLISAAFNVDPRTLVGTQEQPYHALTEADERDIQSKMQELIKDLSSAGALAFSKEEHEELSDESRQLLLASLENSLRIAKQMAKKKFTPKQYRD